MSRVSHIERAIGAAAIVCVIILVVRDASRSPKPMGHLPRLLSSGLVQAIASPRYCVLVSGAKLEVTSTSRTSTLTDSVWLRGELESEWIVKSFPKYIDGLSVIKEMGFVLKNPHAVSSEASLLLARDNESAVARLITGTQYELVIIVIPAQGSSGVNLIRKVVDWCVF